MASKKKTSKGIDELVAIHAWVEPRVRDQLNAVAHALGVPQSQALSRVLDLVGPQIREAAERDLRQAERQVERQRKALERLGGK